MPRFRKKPVVIDAEQWMGRTIPPAPSHLLRQRFRWHLAFTGELFRGERHWQLRTLEGWLWLQPLDVIIRGVAGEYYPCKPAIFAAIYEPVTADASDPHVASPGNPASARINDLSGSPF